MESSVQGGFRRIAHRTARGVGSPWAFFAAVGAVVVWAASGPLFGFSNTWQLIINTGTTVVTLLMVFLIQATQNREGAAMQLKLDELIRCQHGARNIFADLEDATEDEIRDFHAEFKKLREQGLAGHEAAAKAADR